MRNNHIAPKYHAHKIGTFAEVGACLSCHRVSLYEDFNPANPCPQCGATNEQRQWVSAKWVWDAPWWHLFFRVGHWERAQ